MPPAAVVLLLAGLALRAVVRWHRYGPDARGELSEAQQAELAKAATDRLSQPGNGWALGAGPC